MGRLIVAVPFSVGSCTLDAKNKLQGHISDIHQNVCTEVIRVQSRTVCLREEQTAKKGRGGGGEAPGVTIAERFNILLFNHHVHQERKTGQRSSGFEILVVEWGYKHLN